MFNDIPPTDLELRANDTFGGPLPIRLRGKIDIAHLVALDYRANNGPQQHVIGVLCGVVYGLWIGFLVVATGTFLGELGNWFAFKKFLRKKAAKLEWHDLNFAALATLAREGGFWVWIPSSFSFGHLLIQW